jgi:hypothetical protein
MAHASQDHFMDKLYHQYLLSAKKKIAAKRVAAGR